MTTEDIRKHQKDLMGLIEPEREKTPRLITSQSYHVRDHTAEWDGTRYNIWQVVGDKDGRVYAETRFCEIATFIESKLTAEFVRHTLGVPKI